MRVFTLVYIGFVFLSVIPFARAEDAPADRVERIEVTGSHIKRVDVEGVAPVDIVTKKDLEKKGYDNLGDVFRDLNANSFGSFNATGSQGYSTQGNSNIDLHGLGAEKTLVLLNGIRLPPNAHDGVVDINMIPMAAVDRIEILKDGASALYGSDALGGVVNIITVKDFKGTQVDATQSFSTNYGGGKQTNISVVNGIDTGKLNVVTSLNYRYDQAIRSNDRPWFLTGVPSYWSSPGNYTLSSGSGKTFPSSACTNPTPNNSKYSGLTGSTYCGSPPGTFGENATPLVKQFGIMSDANYSLTDTIRLYSRLSYIHRATDGIFPPSPGDHISLSGVTPGALANLNHYAGGSLTNGDDISFGTAPLGSQDWNKTVDGYSALVGAVFQLPKDWQLDTNANFDRVQDKDTYNRFPLVNSSNGITGIVDAINNGTYNPLAPTGSQGTLLGSDYTPKGSAFSLLTDIDAKASTNSLFSVPGGDVGFAVGVSSGFSQYEEVSDIQISNQNVLGLGGSSGAGHRNFESTYAELDGPLFVKELELQLAGRFDHYSDFGSTINPKVGLLYHASNDLLLRGSWGTGFRAPLLQELYGGTSVGYDYYFDSKTNQYTQPQVYSASNPKLNAVTSVSYNVGAVYSPVKDLDLSLDGYYTKDNGDIGTLSDADLDRAVSAGLVPSYTYSTSKYSCDGGQPICVLRDGTGAVQRLIEGNQNLGETQVSGVDASASYTLGKFKVADAHSQSFFYKVTPIAGLSTLDHLGWLGRPRYRNTASIAYDLTDRNHFTLFWHYIPGQSQQKGTDRVYIDSFYQFDLSYLYQTKGWGTLSISLNNILNKSVPLEHYADGSLVLGSYGGASLYDYNGRAVVAGWKYKFD